VQAVTERSDEDFAGPEPSEGLLTAPENGVVALLDGPDEAEAAIGELLLQSRDLLAAGGLVMTLTALR
jgi:hypothetical protein